MRYRWLYTIGILLGVQTIWWTPKNEKLILSYYINQFPEISNRTHWTDPEKTWVSNSSSNLLRGPLGFGPIQFLMDQFIYVRYTFLELFQLAVYTTYILPSGGVICYLPPFTSTRNNHWFLERLKASFQVRRISLITSSATWSTWRCCLVKIDEIVANFTNGMIRPENHNIYNMSMENHHF